tara:strand:- start:668 stop:2866 length:2199 start_codon:yes stop_codon:yes gene_type:complete
MASELDLSGDLKQSEETAKKLAKSLTKTTKSVDGLTKAATRGATGVRNLRNQTDKATGSFTLFQKSLSVARSRLLVLSFGFALVNKSILNLLRTYGEQQKAEIQLAQALGFVSEKLQDKASALQSVTTFGDEEILKAMGLIAAYVKEEDQISNVTEATLNLAAAKGIDLRTAADLVAKSVGSSTNALSRYGIEIKGTVGTHERLNSAVSGINRLYKDQAQVLSQTVLGALDQTSNAFGDLAERIGKDLAPILVPIIKQFKSLAEALDTRRIVSYTTALAGMAFTLNAVKAASWGAAFGVKAFAKAFKVAAIGTGVGIAVVALGELVNALFKTFGWFESTSDSVFKLSKNQEIFNQQTRELNELQEKSAKKLEEQLALLNAKSETDKMLIKLGHEASAKEMHLIRLIVLKKEALEQEAEAVKKLKKEEQLRQTLIGKTSTLQNEAMLLSLELNGANEKTIELAKIQIEGQKALNEAQIDGVLTAQRVGEGFQVNIDTTGELTLAQKSYVEALTLVIAKQGELVFSNQEVMKTGMELWELFDSQASSTLASIDSMNNAEVEQSRQKELRNAEGIKNEKKRRAEIARINKEFDAEQKKRARDLHAWKVGAAISNVALGITQTWRDETMPTWAKWVQTALQAAAGYAQIRTIEAQQFAKGGDFVTSGPQMIMVGDNPGGRERVQVTPLSSPNIAGPQGGQIVVNVSGNVMTSDYVEGELAEQIKEAARRGTDFGIS